MATTGGTGAGGPMMTGAGAGPGCPAAGAAGVTGATGAAGAGAWARPTPDQATTAATQRPADTRVAIRFIWPRFYAAIRERRQGDVGREARVPHRRVGMRLDEPADVHLQRKRPPSSQA